MVRVKEHIDIERIPSSPPVIEPLPKATQRPLWSVMIPVYNCSFYLGEAIASVLKQYPGREKMQIEVVDDASTDIDVEAFVRREGKGFVKYYRQPFNRGSLRNFQTCIERARGQWIHILHADDRVNTGFYSQFEKLFQKHTDLGAAFCRYSYIDKHGRWMYHQASEQSHAGVLQNWIHRLAERQRIQYVSMVVKREVYENLGSFYGVEYGEDWEMWMRIASKYSIGYIPEPMAEYRKHFASISGKSFLTGQNMRDLSKVIENIRQHMPDAVRNRVTRRCKRFYAHYALKVANELWKNLRHRDGAMAQIREAWKMRKDLFLFYKILKLYVRMTFQL